MTGAPDRIVTGLATIRKRRRTLWLTILIGFPLLLVAALTLSARDTYPIVVGLALGFFVWWGIVIVRAGWARCPQCGKVFSATWTHASPFTQHCLHCGLSLRLDPNSGH